MTIRLTKATDVAHKRLSVLIYGSPKVGKTSLAKTLPLTSDDKLLYLAADPGQLALRDRGFVVAQPGPDGLSEQFFDEALDHIRKEGNRYEWIVVDGCDEVADAILHSKLKTQRDGRKAYGEMADYMERWLKAIRDTQGVSVVFITHVSQRDDGDGQVTFIPSFPGKKINESVNAWFDLIGFMRLVKVSDGQWVRQIQFRPEADPRYEVGDRSGVTGLYEEPDLGSLFKKIHEAGFETKGTWSEPTVSTDSLKEYATTLSPEQKAVVRELSTTLYGKPINELTESEFENLKAKFAEESGK